MSLDLVVPSILTFDLVRHPLVVPVLAGLSTLVVPVDRLNDLIQELTVENQFDLICWNLLMVVG